MLAKNISFPRLACTFGSKGGELVVYLFVFLSLGGTEVLFYCDYIEGFSFETFLGLSSSSVINHVSLRPIFSGILSLDICCNISAQFGGYIPYLVKGTINRSSSNTT